MELTQGVRFDTLELSPELLRALLERNIVQSTPVQAGCIPPMLAWRDVIAKAPTGTGKTFAYGIPIVEHIDPEDDSVQAVILAPRGSWPSRSPTSCGCCMPTSPASGRCASTAARPSDVRSTR